MILRHARLRVSFFFLNKFPKLGFVPITTSAWARVCR